MEKTYDVDYFIEKFEAIPNDKWYSGAFVNPYYTDQFCALGHCGMRKNADHIMHPEAVALADIFMRNHFYIAEVNDGLHPSFRQSTPKARIIAALRYIKSKQYPELSSPPVTAEQVIEELEGVTNITA